MPISGTHKYIVMPRDTRHGTLEDIFTFPAAVDHDRMYEAICYIRLGNSISWERKYRDRRPVSAGFVSGGACGGKSETLKIDSRGDADTALLGLATSEDISTAKTLELLLRVCARVAIECTRIPDDALARGTGVRDRTVKEGEEIAKALASINIQEFMANPEGYQANVHNCRSG